MKKFENLPVNVQEIVKEYLKAFPCVDVIFENGDYHFGGIAIKDSYPDDYEVVGTYFAEDIYSNEERIINYVNEFRAYPVNYKGKRDYSILKNHNVKYIYDNEGNIVVA